MLSSEDKQRVQDLAYAWDLPSLTENNRRWLFEKLLIHAVSESLKLSVQTYMHTCF